VASYADAALVHPALAGRDRRSRRCPDQPSVAARRDPLDGPGNGQDAGDQPVLGAAYWKAYGLQPHRMHLFKLSNDPKFAEKLQDVVGLHIRRPTPGRAGGAVVETTVDHTPP
jgi:hypothetical protein